MVNFWLFSAGLAFGLYLFPLPLLASEQPLEISQGDSLKNFDAETIKVQFPQYLIAQERQGERRNFKIPTTETDFQPVIPIDDIEVVEVIADRQEYDRAGEVITAEGNVVMRFAQSVMECDRLEINLKDRIAVATGKVVLKRGQQVLRGSKFEYYFVADRGVVFNAGGEIDRSRLTQDLDVSQELAPNQTILDRALSDRLVDRQPIDRVTANEGFNARVGSSRGLDFIENDNAAGGTINRLRFSAERINFEGTDWEATNLSLTNDPFSPPEIELRSERANLERLSSSQSRLSTSKSRLVIDDRLTVPLLLGAFVFDDPEGYQIEIQSATRPGA